MTSTTITIPCDRPDDDAAAEAILGMLTSVARTLATAADLPLRTRRRLALALRKETVRLRRIVATGHDEADLPRVSIGPEALRLATKPPPRDLQWSILDSVVDGLDVRLLAQVLGRAAGRPDSEALLHHAASALDTAASLLDIAVARTSELVVERERTHLTELLEATVRACSDTVRHRRVTLISTIDAGATSVDKDLLGRALTTLAMLAITSMPSDATLQIDGTAGRAFGIEVSFTGRFRGLDGTSALAGLELVFVREVLAAHGAVVAIDEEGGRTSIRIELPRGAESSLLRTA